MTTAFVLGNGKSRLEVDLHQLKSFGKIYGCNALYRDFSPDVLVATDPEISAEIQNSQYAIKNKFYTRKPINGLGALPIREYFGFSSGPIALSLACMSKADYIFLIGFDLAGIEGKFNNVYADTDFYKNSWQKETFYGNWVNQIAAISKDFPSSRIYHVVGSTTFTPKAWEKTLTRITMDNFLRAINNNKLEQL